MSVQGAASENQMVGRYQLLERIGRGGMAEVFRAKLQSIGGFERDVAVKVLLPQYAAEPEFVEMLLDEARIAGGIDHPNVVQMLDVGREGELFYLVMEYVDGQDLRTIARQSDGARLPLAPSLFVVSQVLRGLEAVHSATDAAGAPRMIVHRDISPGNVMLDRRGLVKLGDFGIAHASGRITRTRVGAVKGKSRYMAPEQLAGQPVDHRADLYAVGVTLFEALLGESARESTRATIYGPMFTWPKAVPRALVPADVIAVLERALAEDPASRYGSAREFRRGLVAALERHAPGYAADELERDLEERSGSAPAPSLPPQDPQAAPRRRSAPLLSLRKLAGVPTSQHTLPVRRVVDEFGADTRLDFSSDAATVTREAREVVGAPLPRGGHRPIAGVGQPPELRRRRLLAFGAIGAAAVLSLALAIALALTGGTPRAPVAGADGVGAPGTAAPLAAPEPAPAPIPRSLAPIPLDRQGAPQEPIGARSPSDRLAEPEEAGAPVAVEAVAAPRVTPLVETITTGRLRVPGPAGTRVWVGGKHGVAPCSLELAPGAYRALLKAPRKRRKVTRRVVVVAGATVLARP